MVGCGLGTPHEPLLNGPRQRREEGDGLFKPKIAIRPYAGGGDRR